MYKLVPTRRFIKQLKKLDRYTQKIITNYLQTNVLEDPRRHGKALLVIALVNGAIELVIIELSYKL